MRIPASAVKATSPKTERAPQIFYEIVIDYEFFFTNPAENIYNTAMEGLRKKRK